jgi:hypothetical protein
MNNIKFTKIFAFLFYLLFLAMLLKNSFSYLDPDFGWHLKVGEETYINKEVPRINHYNYIFPESENFWVNHEWLSDYLIFLVYDNFGYIVLNLIFALLVLATLYIVNRFIIKEIIKNEKVVYFLLPLELIGLKAMFPHLGVRVQEISLLFLSLLLIIIYFFEKRALKNKRGYWKTLFFLIPLFYLWANLHAGFLLGMALLFFYLGVKLAERILCLWKNTKLKVFLNKFFNFKGKISRKAWVLFLLFSVLASLSTLFTPYGLSLYDFLHSYTNTAYLNLISEWLPQFRYPFMYWQLLYIGLVASVLIIALISTKEKKIKPWEFALVLLFIILSIKSKRHFPLLFFISLPFLIESLYQDFKVLLPSRSNNKLNLFLKSYISILLICVILMTSLNINFTSRPFESFCHHYPCGAIIFLKERDDLLEANIFNHYGWGGFLIHEYPERPLFIDGRLPQKELKGHSYIEEYGSFYSSEKEDLKEKIRHYKLELFLLAKNREVKLNYLDKKLMKLKEENFSSENRLIDFLEEQEGWEKIYEDDISLIYYNKK